MTKIAVAIGVLALNAYVFYFSGMNEETPPRRSFAEFPLELEGWSCGERQEMEPKIEQRLGVTDYLVCNFQREGTKASGAIPFIGLYVGYHERQVREGGQSAAKSSIHPPRHCLPGAGWNIVKAQTVQLALPGFPDGGGTVNRLVVAKGDMRQLVYYWYHSRGHVIAQDWQKLAALFWDRATSGRSDGSLVRFTIPLRQGSMEEADAAFRDLASKVVPRLSAHVPD